MPKKKKELKKVIRRITPEDDLLRMEERISLRHSHKIKDRDSFDLAFREETGLSDSNMTKKRKEFRDEVFKLYLKNHPKVSEERLHKKAGGKDLKKDRGQTAKEVLIDKEEYKKKGAKRFDFAGYDIDEKELDKIKAVDTNRFKIWGKVGKKVALVRPVFITIKGRKVQRYRDPKGRFASVK